LEDINWKWSVVTVGYCEFLVLDRETYRKIFVTGASGGLLKDKDLGVFMRYVIFCKSRWHAYQEHLVNHVLDAL